MLLRDSCCIALPQISTYTHLPLQVAGRTNDAAGDGTTTASVLAREMIHFGLQAVSAGANPVAVKKGLDKTCAFLVKKLRENATQISGTKDIKVGCAWMMSCEASVADQCHECWTPHAKLCRPCLWY